MSLEFSYKKGGLSSTPVKDMTTALVRLKIGDCGGEGGGTTGISPLPPPFHHHGGGLAVNPGFNQTQSPYSHSWKTHRVRILNHRQHTESVFSVMDNTQSPYS